MGKSMFFETSPPPVESPLTEENPSLELVSCMFIPTHQPLVETPITQENPNLELTLQIPTLQLFPVQSAVQEPEPVQSPILTMFPQPIPPPQQPILYLSPPSPPHIHPRKRSRRDQQRQRTDTIDAPFSWATNQRARVHSFHYLIQNEIFDIKGDVECKKCETKFQISFDVREKFPEIYSYILNNRHRMNERAPVKIWKNPTLPDCVHCNKKNCVKPIIADKKKKINWLFLFLGQMLGCCNITQLKYCCKYNNNHRTGAKDRVLYSTYLALCNQLRPI